MKRAILLLFILALGITIYLLIAKEENGSPTPSLINQKSEIPEKDGDEEVLKLDSEERTYSMDQPNEYNFSISKLSGETLKDFEITHTKLMHMIVVRKDLNFFQHLHPEFDSEKGMFSLKDLSFPEEGEYRIFADFKPVGSKETITLHEDIKVGEVYEPIALGSEERTKTFEDFEVSLETHDDLQTKAESMLMFNLSKNGEPITNLEEYLGALGHTVILKENTLDFIHAHPHEMEEQNGTVNFMVEFPEPGRYKIFTQFQIEGKVLLTEFVVTVKENENPEAASGISSMDHSMH